MLTIQPERHGDAARGRGARELRAEAARGAGPGARGAVVVGEPGLRPASGRRRAVLVARGRAERLTGEARHEPGPQQARVVAREPALVLAEARLGELPERHLADRLGHLHGEVVALVRATQLERRLHAPERLERDAEATAHQEAGLPVER